VEERRFSAALSRKIDPVLSPSGGRTDAPCFVFLPRHGRPPSYSPLQIQNLYNCSATHTE